MAFTTKRGRPRRALPTRDLGTPELVFKRLHRLTQEALDQCLEMGWISEQQHWSGMHFRWLYTLRYGVPGPQAIDLTRGGMRGAALDSESWRAERERDYLDAVHLLHDHGVTKTVLEVCVYDQLPSGLRRRAACLFKPAAMTSGNRIYLDELRTGLELLEWLWH